MNNMEPFVFDNKTGLKLFGILHSPDEATKKDAAILLLSPGVKMRVAPHRLYNKIAEEYVSLGFPVFRFDFYGLGDAEGMIDEPILADVYNSIQDGCFVDDTLAAMDWMENKFGYKKFILAGLCGGAITGLLAAKDDPRVVGLIHLNIPVAFEPSPSDRHRYLTETTVTKLRAGYWRRLLSPVSWYRLLTFKSEYKVIIRVLSQLFQGKKRGRPAKQNSQKSESTPGVKGNLNPKFSPAFFNILDRSHRMLLIFCGADRWISEYEEKFALDNQGKIEKYGNRIQKHIIENANHVLTENSWQDEMLAVSTNWLKEY